jgi:hypothetical protein
MFFGPPRSASGSVIYFTNPDPDPSIKFKKNFDFYGFVTFFMAFFFEE